MLDYASLAALAAVVREGSFERAARALHVTPSAISQRVRLLEERVGCALVVRGQPCQATDTGRRLCQHVDRVRLLEHELHAGLPTLDPTGEARVRLPVAVNADSLATWFAPAVAAFAASAPRERVSSHPWPQLSHEIFNEVEQADVLAAMSGWLQTTFPAQN